MRRLATVCAAFAVGIFAAQYALTQGLLLYAAGGFAVLGALSAALLRGGQRTRAVLVALGLALALLYDWAYIRGVQAPFEALSGSSGTMTLEAADYPTATEYGCRVEVRILGRGLHGTAIYYGGASLLDLEPGARVSGKVYASSAAAIRDTEVATFTSRGTFLLLYARGEAAVESGRVGSPRYLPQRLARRMLETIDDIFPGRTRAFLRAILLGDRYELSEEDGTYLSEAGLYHITAVSGLHCAFLLSLLNFLFGKHRQRLLSAVAIPVLVFYAVMVGLTPSVMRACVMLAMVLLAPLFGRESDPPTSLFFALFLILAANPFAAKSVSLQLSFSAMAGILWLAPRIYDRFDAKVRTKFGNFVLASLAASAGVLAFNAPLAAYYFNFLPLVMPLSNLLCLWAASLTFAAGLLVTLTGLALPAVARVLAYAPHATAWYILTCARYLTKLPYHAVYFSNNYLKYWLAYVYALLGACYIMKRGKWRYATAGMLAVATLALTVWCARLPMRGGSLHVVALDIGQGQSAVLYSRGSAALVDCGSSSYVSAGDVTADYLQSVGIDRLDYIVVSHYHSDHCNGLPVLLSRIGVGTLVLPDIEQGDALREQVIALAERYGIPVVFVYEPRTFALGEAALTVYPPVAEGDMNEEGLTALCTTGSFDALFTGDMDAKTEYLLIATYPLPDVEVMLAGHHGSRYSTGGDLLAEVRPEVGVVSCGANNSYGHPHDAALRRLADAGAAIYRTDSQGNIHITVN